MKLSKCFIVAALSQRYQQCLESREVAEEYFENLTDANPCEDIYQWTEEIDYAEKVRREQRSAMDIMASRLSEMRHTEKETQSADENSAGDCWIELGLSMEERQ